MTNITSAWTYLRRYPLLAAPVAVGLPIAVGFLVVGSPSKLPMPAARPTVHFTSIPVVGSPAVSPFASSSDEGSTGAPNVRLGQLTGSRNAAQIELARSAAASSPAVGSSATRRGQSTGSAGVAAGPSASGGLGLTLARGGSTNTGSDSSLSSLQLSDVPGLSVHAVNRVQPVAGASAQQQVQDWVATPSDTSTSGNTSASSDASASSDLAAQLAAAGYNMTGQFTPLNQPQLVADFLSYVGSGLNPSYAYGTDGVSSDEAAIFQQLGFTLMKDVDTSVHFWVGPELALNPEFTPVTS
jgi:hypothetical protein